MNIDKMIEGLNRFDDNIACCYEECPIYRVELQACNDGEEVCLCLSEAVKILRKVKYVNSGTVLEAKL